MNNNVQFIPNTLPPLTRLVNQGCTIQIWDESAIHVKWSIHRIIQFLSFILCRYIGLFSLVHTSVFLKLILHTHSSDSICIPCCCSSWTSWTDFLVHFLGHIFIWISDISFWISLLREVHFFRLTMNLERVKQLNRSVQNSSA